MLCPWVCDMPSPSFWLYKEFASLHSRSKGYECRKATEGNSDCCRRRVNSGFHREWKSTLRYVALVRDCHGPPKTT